MKRHRVTPLPWILRRFLVTTNATSELSYESQYFTPVAIAGLIEDVPHRLVPVGDLEVTSGGFEEEVRDGDVEPDSVASQVAEQVLEEDEDDTQVRVCFSCLFLPRANIRCPDPYRRGVVGWDRRRAIHVPGRPNLLSSSYGVQAY